jgi:hypothetical protein
MMSTPSTPDKDPIARVFSFFYMLAPTCIAWIGGPYLIGIIGLISPAICLVALVFWIFSSSPYIRHTASSLFVGFAAVFILYLVIGQTIMRE